MNGDHTKKKLKITFAHSANKKIRFISLALIQVPERILSMEQNKPEQWRSGLGFNLILLSHKLKQFMCYDVHCQL